MKLFSKLTFILGLALLFFFAKNSKALAASYSCDIAVSNFYTSQNFDFTIANAVLDQQPISISNAQIYVDGTRKGTFNIEVGNANVTNVGFPIALPDTSIPIVIKDSSGTTVCQQSFTLARNPDPKKSQDGEGTGCCSNTIQCTQWFGPNSVCDPVQKSNGQCSSGVQCYGGIKGYYIKVGEVCTIKDKVEQGNRCESHACINGTCTLPCADNDLTCIKNRYPTITTGVSKPSVCNLQKAIRTSEKNVTKDPDINGHIRDFSNFTGLCPNLLCIEYRSRPDDGSAADEAAICYDSASTTNCGPQDPKCIITESSDQKSFYVNTKCMAKPHTYNIKALDGTAVAGGTLYGNQDVKLDAGINSLTIPNGFALPVGQSVRINITEPGSVTDLCHVIFTTIKPPGEPNPVTQAEFDLCKQTADAPKNGLPGGPEFIKCNQCLCGKDVCNPNETTDSKKVWTAFGCFQTTPYGIVSDFIKIAIGISGGVILLTILAGAFILATSSGDPKKVQEAQEMISQAIMGFLFFIFSIVILRFIVIGILKIPAFGV